MAATSKSKEFSPRCPTVGSVIEYFESENSVQIKSGEKFLNLIPVEENTFYTKELSQGYEHSYFFIKFFSSIEPLTAMTPVDGGYVEFQATYDLPNFGQEVWRTLSEGVIFTRLIDNPDRIPTTAIGPLKKAKVTLGGGLPTGATHFIAWIVMF